MPQNLTLTTIDKVFGSAEYSIAGTFPEDEEINEIQVIVRGQNDINPFQKHIVLRPCFGKQPRLLPSIEYDALIDIGRCFPAFPLRIPEAVWNQTPTEKFMERLWAFKRINYLLGDKAECTRGIDQFADDEELSQTTTEATENEENDLESN